MKDGGELTIDVDTTPGSTVSGEDTGGHAWLRLASNNGTIDTYGTWSTGTGTGPGGLRPDQSLGRLPNVSKTAVLSSEQITTFNEQIRMYGFLGERAWTVFSPCSSFACNVWNTVTGQSLSDGFISTPANLAKSIQRNP